MQNSKRTAVEAVASFLKERDENVLPGEADDEERKASAQCIVRVVAKFSSPTNLENAERAEMTMTPHAYAQEYEFRGDTDYTPSDFERTMIEDAILGYLGEARIAERAERGTFSPPFSYVPIPLDEEGQGPADDVDAVSVAHDVWDANCVTVATCGNEEAARSVAALMNAGVEARIRAERAEMEPKVKPLEWRVEGENRNGPWLWEASSIVKGYTIRHMPNDLYKLDGHGEWATLKAAKAAAQSDFEARIRSRLLADKATAGEVERLRAALERSMNDLKALTKAIRARGGPELQDAGASGEAAWKAAARTLTSALTKEPTHE